MRSTVLCCVEPMGPEANLGKLRQRYRLEYDCNSFSYTGARAFNMQCLTPNTKCPWAQTRATNAAPSPVVCLAARQGFGKSNKKTVESTEQTGSYTMRTNKKRVNLEQLGKEEQASQPSSSGPSPQVDFTKGNW